MTDIQRQVVPLIKLLSAALDDEPDGSSAYLSDADRSRIRESIRQALPAGYGVSTGSVVDARGRRSASLDVIIYDRPLAGNAYTDESRVFQHEHVLGVICFEKWCDHQLLLQTIEKVASLKRIQPNRTPGKYPSPSRSPGLFGAKIPKSRLPVALVIFWDLVERFEGSEAHFVLLKQALCAVELAQRPDYLTITRRGIGYRHPLLDAPSPEPYTTGLSRLPDLHRPGSCYVCNTDFHRRHFFYDMLCQRCGDLNYDRRMQSADLTGRIALVTGARVKIGYAVALRLLRAGAAVIATTRFPRDAARRFASEHDFEQWADRLHIYGLDMRHLPAVQQFIDHLYTAYPHLDILINNAAQTVRRPPAYYAHLMPAERLPDAELASEIRQLLPSTTAPAAALPPGNQAALWFPAAVTASRNAAELSQVPILPDDETVEACHFPLTELDADGQQVDRRPANSWVMRLDDVALPELLEVQLVNVTAPTMLISGLKALMLRSPRADRYIINVSSVEGQFSQGKTSYHPHTNMAKAALNMLTYSSAPDYAEAGIYMNAVDPGWISHQAPNTTPEIEQGRVPLPLDMLDAAARACDPVFAGVKLGDYRYGKFFKDYDETPW